MAGSLRFGVLRDNRTDHCVNSSK